MLVGGLTVGLALGGAGIAFAATSGSTPPNSTPANPAAPAPGAVHRGLRGPIGALGFGGLGALGRVLHGQFTTPAPGGGYRLVDVQAGKVAGKPTTTLTVTSADGYTHSYSVSSSTVVDAQRDGISSVGNGDQVEVVATSAKGKDTATVIVDLSKVGASRKAFGFGPRPVTPPAPATQSAE
jgi:hypothetical protein